MDDKKTGSYYTPLKIVEFMVHFLVLQGQNFQCTLEPSAGDGRLLPVKRMFFQILSQKLVWSICQIVKMRFHILNTTVITSRTMIPPLK